ncbi:MAG: peptidoglycan DD-metalloendopeptidase family protein [Bacteroidales bacterium]|nr:peptidoglycan DD-metalloendopeptidase family protein [Bacteroidales bacterium]
MYIRKVLFFKWFLRKRKEQGFRCSENMEFTEVTNCFQGKSNAAIGVFLVPLITFLFCLIVVFANCQTKQELESKKAKNRKDIKFTNQLIKETEKSKRISYNKLVIVKNKINIRNELINNINSEIEIIDNNVLNKQNKVIELNIELEKLKKEYAKIIYYTYISRSNYDKIMFIFSSEDFNQAYRRMKYLRQYSEYRIEQAKNIVKTKNELNNEMIELELQRAEKKELVYEKNEENEVLAKENKEQKILINELKKSEKELRKKLKNQKLIAGKLQKEIERIIAEEARKAAEKAGSVDGAFKLTPEDKLISDNFGKNKKHLPWPTERGIVICQFGEHNHPVLKGIIVRNDGIDILTTKNAVVRSVFDGEVSTVFTIPGLNKSVIVRHGNYLTVYSNLKEVIVKTGDKITAKQTIGVIYTDVKDNNKTLLKFQIWKENLKLNPVYWLASSK